MLFAVDGYRYGGKGFDRLDVVAGLEAEMPSLEHTIVLPYLDPSPTFPAWRNRCPGTSGTIASRGTAVIYGRSDSTINRGGIRMGTSEIYRVVLSLHEITDALVVDVPRAGTEGWMPLFVVLREGVELDDELIKRIAAKIRSDCSPRHVPNDVLAIAEVPRTLSGKVLEVPVKRILIGTREPA